jgi:hypothetical protein
MRFDNPFTNSDTSRVDWDAVTPYMYAAATFEGIRSLYIFQKFYLTPLFLHGLIKLNLREQALMEMHYRLVGYLASLQILNSPIHFQAIAATARSLFELGLDITLFSNDSTNDSVERLHAFTRVERPAGWFR